MYVQRWSGLRKAIGCLSVGVLSVTGSDSRLALALSVIAAKALAPCPCHRSLPIRHWGSSPRCKVQGRRFE